MNFLKKFEQKMNRFAIGGIINYVCAMLAMGTVLYLVAPGFLNYLILNPIAIMHGQVWRILTFFVYPPAFTGGNPMGYILFNALAIYCIRSFGMIVEQVWGKFRFNCYIILGVLLNVAASLFMYLVVGFPMVLTPVYLLLFCICAHVPGYAGPADDGPSPEGQVDCVRRGSGLYLLFC